MFSAVESGVLHQAPLSFMQEFYLPDLFFFALNIHGQYFGFGIILDRIFFGGGKINLSDRIDLANGAPYGIAVKKVIFACFTVDS